MNLRDLRVTWAGKLTIWLPRPLAMVWLWIWLGLLRRGIWKKVEA